MSEKTPGQDYFDRLKRTPTSEAEIILTNLGDAYQRLVADLNGDKKYKGEKLEEKPFHETSYFKSLADPGAMSGYELECHFKGIHPADDDGVFKLDEIHALLISLAYCIQALRADEQGQRDLAWTYIIDSRTWFSVSLSLKPKRIEKLKERRALSHKRAISGKRKHEKLYKPHVDFVFNEYKAGLKDGRWENPFQAREPLAKMLTAWIETNKMWRTSPENREEWIYRTLINFLSE